MYRGLYSWRKTGPSRGIYRAAPVCYDGLMLMVSSQELLMIFIGLELTSLPLYVMTAFDKTDRRSAKPVSNIFCSVVRPPRSYCLVCR